MWLIAKFSWGKKASLEGAEDNSFSSFLKFSLRSLSREVARLGFNSAM